MGQTTPLKVVINPTQFLANRIDHKKLPGKIFYSFFYLTALCGVIKLQIQILPKKTSARLFKRGLGNRDDYIFLIAKYKRNTNIYLDNWHVSELVFPNIRQDRIWLLFILRAGSEVWGITVVMV